MSLTHKPKVAVLLSTYNGEKYLRQQLDSIYNQEGVDITLLVRDDGSTDNTLKVLEEERLAGKLNWYTGENLKPARSFWHLLTTVPETDYYAFADQDDFWMKDKLAVACEVLQTSRGIPSLYFCQTQLADEQLNLLPNVPINPMLTYGEALIHQFVGGCTMVMNHLMREILLRYTPKYLQMHDFWIYDVALAVGANVVFDSTPHMLYRQHGKNAVGQLNDTKFVWKSRWERFRKNEHIRLRTAQELWEGYRELMSDENKALTLQMVNYQKSLSAKWDLLWDKRLTCSKKSVTLSTKVALLLNLF